MRRPTQGGRNRWQRRCHHGGIKRSYKQREHESRHHQPANRLVDLTGTGFFHVVFLLLLVLMDEPCGKPATNRRKDGYAPIRFEMGIHISLRYDVDEKSPCGYTSMLTSPDSLYPDEGNHSE